MQKIAQLESRLEPFKSVKKHAAEMRVIYNFSRVSGRRVRNAGDTREMRVSW